MHILNNTFAQFEAATVINVPRASVVSLHRGEADHSMLTSVSPRWAPQQAGRDGRNSGPSPVVRADRG